MSPKQSKSADHTKISDAPKGITYTATYEPDMNRMVKALLILLNYEPDTISAKSIERGREAV